MEVFKNTTLLKDILLFVLAIAFFILAIILALIMKRCSLGQKVVAYFQNKLMYNSVLRAMIQIYLATAISTCVSYYKLLNGVDEDIWVVLGVTVFLIGFPIFSHRFQTKKGDDLQDKEVKAKFGSLY